MSLIVSKKINKQIIIVSDTKLVYSQDDKLFLSQNSLASGTIKTIILSHNICLSFSGESMTVLKVLRSIGDSKNIKDIIGIIKSIKSQNINTKLDADFILSYFDEECHMLEFKGSNPNPNEANSSWIGSYEGFSNYQDRYHNYPNHIERYNGVAFSIERVPEGLGEKGAYMLSNMRRSLEYVINNEKIDEVGGFSITVGILDNEFKYLSRAQTYREPVNIDEINKQLSFTDSSRGGYTVNMFSDSMNSIAVHIYQGALGILFNKNEDNFLVPMIFKNVDEIEFIYIMEHDYNIHGAFGITANHTLYYTDAQKYWETDTDKAIYFLNKAIVLLRKTMLKIENDIPQKSDSLEYFSKLDPYEKNLLRKYYFNLGVCYYKNGEYLNAKKAWEDTLIIDKDYTKAKCALSEIP